MHEASFGDGMAEDARAKKHSTVGEAIAVGRDMSAHRVISRGGSSLGSRLACTREEWRGGSFLACESDNIVRAATSFRRF